MSRDFFLLNRCYQIAKLTEPAVASAFPLPSSAARSKLPIKLSEFYARLDRIRAIAVGSHVGSSLVAGAPVVDESSPVQLTERQRRDLEEFERAVVAARFAQEPLIKQPAVALIRAIFADAVYFSGLKPLPQYTDAFAYELLFPSWLNLLKACMLPRADDGKPRLDGDRQGALFEFLSEMSTLSENDQHMLVGFLTFIASRFDAPQCEELLQCAVDLVALEGSTTVAALDSIDMLCKDARQLRERMADYLIVKYTLVEWPSQREYVIAYKRPARRAIPKGLSISLCELEAQQQWSEFFQIAGPLRSIIQSEHALSPDFVALLNDVPRRSGELLELLAVKQADGSVKVLSSEGQDCIGKLARLEPALVSSDFSQLQQFATGMAPRLEGLSEATLKYFQRVLVDDAGGRGLLLASCSDANRRSLLADQLLTRAGQTDDNTRFLKLLACVCVVSPRAEANDAKLGLLAIDGVVSNRSIGNKELNDLVGDLHANSQQSIDYLASPMMAAAGKSPRLAALYLTLNEISQKLAASGSVDNFSVVRAKYAKLTNMDYD